MAVDFQKDLILVTCASGKQASKLIPLLSAQWSRLRLAVNSEASAARLRDAYPKAEVVRADMSSLAECARLLEQVTTVFHVGPSFHRHETEIGYNMIDAAKAQSQKAASDTNTFRHFILSSVLNTQIRKMMNHDCKRYVEEYLIESGLDFTILQPTHFMDNFPIGILINASKQQDQDQQQKTTIPTLFNPHIPFSFIALRDLGEASARIIREREKHYLAQYQLCSTRPISYAQAIDMATKKVLPGVLDTNKSIDIKTAPLEDAAKMLLDRLYGDHEKAHPASRDAAERMLLYYNRHGLVGNPNVLRWLLGREPTGFEDWIALQL